MAASAGTEHAKKICQRHDNPQHAKPQAETTVPPSWKLTPQQQEFIDSFAKDDASEQ
ncbi:hypothetical protein [Phytobacter sp. V91]|uniref:hypothetical protein n=1 Tax=Phytobacter sp. V91 TaxID=3369425 RepID=UPI003F5DB10F